MNGEMNGAIEEPMENSPVPAKNESPTFTEESGDHCDTASNADETSNHKEEEDNESQSNDQSETSNTLDSLKTEPSSERKESPAFTEESGDQCDAASNADETSNHKEEEDNESQSNDQSETSNTLDSLKTEQSSKRKESPTFTNDGHCDTAGNADETSNTLDSLKTEPSSETNVDEDELKSAPSTSESQKNCANDKNETDLLIKSDKCQNNQKEKNLEKLEDGTSKTKADAGNEESDEVDSEQDSSDEDGSVISANPRPDTVSINSESEMDDDDNSQESHLKIKNEVVILDNENRATSYNGSSCDAASPEIHEITSDNDDECVVTNTGKTNAVRCSGRQIKIKKFDKDFVNGDEDENEEESDIEEVELDDPLKRKTRPIVISNAKTLVDIAKQSKLTQGNQKKGTTVVIIDSPTKISPVQGKTSAQNTSGVTSRNTPSGVAISKATGNQSSQPSILPSLTDDMFVVEAPSFIVPYVYEKPSLKPFREYVDILGRELEEQKAKEEKERLEKEKADKETRDKEKKDKIDRGEVMQDSEEKPKIDTEKDEEEAKKKKAEKKERRQLKKEDDDASWDGESSSESEDEILSDEESKTVVLKDKADSIEEIKDISSLTEDKISAVKSDNYFDCSLGKFFVNIGMNLVQEFVQTDLLKQQNRKLYKEKKAGTSIKSTQSSIMSLIKNIEFSKENNAPYSFTQVKCEFCSFKSESSIVLSNHLETPHMKNNVYKCNFCSFEIKSPHEILLHMDTIHKVRGRLERAPAYHQCANCPFEDNGKGKLARHLIPCAKKFKPDLNLAPPVEWEPPAKIPKITRSRNSLTGPYGHSFGRGGQGGSGQMSRPALGLGAPGAQFRARGRSPLAPPVVRTPITGVPILRGGVVIRQSTPTTAHLNSKLSVTNNGKAGGKGHQPSISITPLPRQPPPTPQPLPGSQGKSSFVICEICDGYIKDLEQLRNHMQWIHRVKIHPKMIYNRPPLNCQKCQFRFFTDQGLERHLLGSHGLVTSSMQEAANKGKDAGRCPVCGRVYQWKLLAHVARDHNLTLKPAHLSYKCTVCTATFGMYKQFENHVYSAHSVVAKRVMDKGKATPSTNKASNDSLLKPVKINDEITIIPQPVKTASSTSTKHK